MMAEGSENSSQGSLTEQLNEARKAAIIGFSTLANESTFEEAAKLAEIAGDTVAEAAAKRLGLGAGVLGTAIEVAAADSTQGRINAVLSGIVGIGVGFETGPLGGYAAAQITGVGLNAVEQFAQDPPHFSYDDVAYSTAAMQ